VLLQAVRDSNVTFRGIDGNTRDCRLTNWEEMQLNQLVYINGEVVKLFRSPRGPDSGFLFYEGDGGRRLCYFDTTATAHAVEEPCYVVQPHPPGAKLVSTGLPVFPVYYANDDDGQRRLGSDSRLSFTAPADGSYLVRVRDARGDGGDRFAYRLTVRPPRPDFAVRLNGANPKIALGSGKKFTLEVERADGFDDEVHVDLSGLPAGFQCSTPIVIQAGHREADGVLLAAPDAPQPSAEALGKITVAARARVAGKEVVKPVNNFGQITLEAKPKLLVRLEPAELVVAPGTTIAAMLKVERNGHDDLVTFSVENLPHGVIVDNIGLNGVLLPKGENERQIFITADSWVPETSCLAFAIENQAGGQCSKPVVVHVRRPSPLAGAAGK
ncbi:MAG TPA: PPC domain-containing protein, partial [Pirellulales bacterium]|nr:PPC domain-containing protein [Pirellulales bacterium]